MKIIERAKEMGAECAQIFGGSPRRYEVPKIEKREAEEFRAILTRENISPLFIHASYLLNLASEDEVLRKKSIESLVNSLRFAENLGAKGVIYHPGSPKGGDKKKAIEREAISAKEVLSLYKGSSLLVLENTAGKKKIGTNPDEVGELMKKISSSRTAVCVDTAHSFESGNIKNFSEGGVKEWVNWWDESIGLNKVVALHINDSKTKNSSENDRHENIGNGFIGIEGFVSIARNGAFQDIPWILEVPGFDGKGPDKKNIEILKSIFN